MIRVLIVEDSPTVVKLLVSLLNSDPEILLVGTTGNGSQAVEMTTKLTPDLVTMDMHLVGIDGDEATKRVMAYCPTPILILSYSTIKEKRGKVFKALSYGALDVMEKAPLEEGATEAVLAKAKLIEKIKFLSKIKVIPHPLAHFEKIRKPKIAMAPEKPKRGRRIIGMVTSTGGPQALLSILKGMPKELPVPIVIVQHLSLGFAEGMSEWLAGEIALKVKLAVNGEPLKNGVVYLAQPGLHMRVSSNFSVALSDEEPREGQKPSGTTLLESLAHVYGKGCLGIILTGMGRDGADGIKAVFEAEGYTIAQDEKTAVVYGMPKEATAMGVVDTILPLHEIPAKILEWVDG